MKAILLSFLCMLASSATLAQSTCPANVGYLRSKLVFSEIKDNPGFDESLDGMIMKGGGVANAVSEVEKLIQGTEVSMEEAAQTAKRSFSGAGNALASRCAKPEGTYCSANYSYHLMREAIFYYQEILSGLRCRQTGTMDRGSYTAAPLR